MKNHLRAGIGIVLSLLLLWWALRDVSFHEVFEQIRAADHFLLALSAVITLGGFWARAVRWGVLLLPVAGSVPFRPRAGATFIGFALNNLLPARVGEFARVYSLGRLTDVRIGSALATLVIERLLDGIALVALLFLAIAAPGFPSAEGGTDVQSGALMVATIMGLVVVALFLAVIAPRRAAAIAYWLTDRLPARLRKPIVAALRSFARGLGVLKNAKLFAVSLVLAFAQWAFLASSFLVGFRAFGIDSVPFSGAVFLQSLISMAVAIPSSPGFFGPFEAGARIGLGIYGVPVDQAISFAIGYHIAGFIPVTLIGLWYLWRLNIGWSAVRSSEARVEAEETLQPSNHPTP